MKLNRNLYLAALVFLPVFSWASEAAEELEAGAHHAIEIPFEQIGWQAANLGILLIILFVFIRKSIAETFANRQKSFLEQSKKTEAALRAAEASLVEIKSKIKDIEAGEEASIKNAVHEANLLKAHMIKESEDQALKMKSDVALLLASELEKAKNEIRETVVNEAISQVTQKAQAAASGFTKDSEKQFLDQVAQVKI